MKLKEEKSFLDFFKKRIYNASYRVL